MDYEKTKVAAKDVGHIALLIVLVLIALGLLTYSGFVKCSAIPGWCNVYDAVLGKPRVLIVFGSDGLGEPEVLAQMLANPKNLGVRPTLTSLSRINAGNLKDYQLVIVERAKTMDTKTLKEFVDYVDSGGRLVWTGDAGTIAPSNELLYKDDLDANESHELYGVWSRKLDGQSLRFDEVISVQFVGNYCDLEQCSGATDRVGRLDAVDESHALVVGLNPSLQLHSNFSIVKEGTGIGSKRVLNVELTSHLQQQNLGNNVPAIVVSGLGEKIAYYAVPPEQFWITTPETPAPVRSNLLVENLYLGMVR